LTGFRDNTTLASYARKRSELIKFLEAIPILHKGEPKYGEMEQLELESGWMRKKSWIRLQHVLLVPVSYFWKYDWHEGAHAYDQRLTKQSYERLMSLVNMEGDEYETTGSVVTNAISRLARLASQEGWKLREKDGQQHRAIQESGILPSENQQFETDKGRLAAYPLAEHVHLHSNYSAQRNSLTQDAHLENRPSFTNDTQAPWASFQPRHTYPASSIYPPSQVINNSNLHHNDKVNPEMMPNNAPGYIPGYGTPHISQPLNFHPIGVPQLCQQPAINHNYNFHGSTANFNGPLNHDARMIPGHDTQPSYHNLEQQWQQSLVQQQRALNRYFDQQVQQNRQPGCQYARDDGKQGMAPQQNMHQYPGSQPLKIGQPMSHRPASYGQMAQPYSPIPTPTQLANPFLQPLLEQQQRNRAMPTQPQPQTRTTRPRLQSPRMPFQSPHPRSQPTLNFQTNRTAPWSTNLAYSDNGSTVSNGRASTAGQRFYSPPRPASYRSPQVEGCEESEAGRLEGKGDDMDQN
jgi:hypothetical protein